MILTSSVTTPRLPVRARRECKQRAFAAAGRTMIEAASPRAEIVKCQKNAQVPRGSIFFRDVFDFRMLEILSLRIRRRALAG